LTNKHVIQEIWELQRAPILEKIRQEKLTEVKPRIWVFFGKQKFVAEIRHVSDRYDFGILKVDRRPTPFFALSASDKLPRAARVLACGFPGEAIAPISQEELVKQEVLLKLPEKEKIEAHFKE